jgi:large subunit ribosomal protein L10
MTRTEKENLVVTLRETFSKANVYVLADYSGMTVEEIQHVKRELRKAKGRFQVVKNRLAIRAAVGTPLEKVSSHFKGPVALALGFDDPIAPVKAFNGLLNEQKKLKMKVGVIENRVVDLATFREVAKLPKREELLGQLLVRMQSPLYGFAGALAGVMRKFVGVLHAVKTSRESA